MWLHNQLQIEKSLRKKQLWPIIKYKPHVVFVSDYLKKKLHLFIDFQVRLLSLMVVQNYFLKIKEAKILNQFLYGL